MAEPAPPGRAGRLWLLGRLTSAQRSLELLDRKQQLLQRELLGLAARHEEARRLWDETCAEAERWGLRAAVLGGDDDLAMTAGAVAGGGRVELAWSNTMGVRHPGDVRYEPAALPPLEAAAANGATGPAADAYAAALAAAVAYAALDRSLQVLGAELAATRRRRRAIERRRIPALEEALAQLLQRLDELERGEQVVAHWTATRRRPDRHS